MSDVRRCRRCKRKRLDDEPPEVRQYKTCAKCRIIERQKKKSRKPLAEETMLYGMKQFQQQHQTSNFMSNDIFMDDDAFGGSMDSNGNTFDNEVINPSQQQQQFYHFQPQQTPRPAIQAPVSIPQTNQHQQLQLQQQQHMRNVPVQVSMPQNGSQQPSACEVCSCSLDTTDDLSMLYRLCRDCYTNPFKKDNVFEDYNNFLLNISNNRYKNLKNYIFIKEISSHFADGLAVQSKPINSERVYREFLLESIQMIYVDPIIASLNYKYNRSSTNIADVSSLPPVFNQSTNQYHYKNTKPLKSFHKFYRDSISDASIYLSFDISTGILTIKLNQTVVNASGKYPESFLEIVDSMLKKLVEKHGNMDSSVGYNQSTAQIIYNDLVTNKAIYQQVVTEVIDSLSKEDFIRDFVSFENGKSSSTNSTTEKNHHAPLSHIRSSIGLTNGSDNDHRSDMETSQDEIADNTAGIEEDDEEEDDDDDEEDDDDDEAEIDDDNSEDDQSDTDDQQDASNAHSDRVLGHHDDTSDIDFTMSSNKLSSNIAAQPDVLPSGTLQSEGTLAGVGKRDLDAQHYKSQGENLDPAFGS
ncbi:Piso0_001923 [Millerozyma farinosa CBS 7064]|uniref:Piso0_001923 protein n=1 Tax=Pichia sorbitophila (strain ATCC MYA-4447 / BCRC 22081 / CBS 7064 / NBRC 10061 / NRRL Y-12695) TaxID=559304 RepID=G8YB79_PICSO|nr:Piso0_001923 [Millerozyma farinosa CBS 7064]